ncbi:hypothetical protein DEO72_LG8g406 [Vigna unguiculata]|uniref:Uncharacterized protein n=1 Tax=Vigna unguiculata TaxID=3917 RepID=A0A4D6MNR0_VIGUN|nr:hypothetical protein DEO72_LG8g406 [Vigna unguiculata]
MSLRSSSLSSRPSYPTSSIATPLFAATPLLSCPSTSFLRESSCSTVHRRSSTNSSPPNRILLVSETRVAADGGGVVGVVRVGTGVDACGGGGVVVGGCVVRGNL